MQGVLDRILPIDATGHTFHNAFPESEYVEIEGGPHGFGWSHAAEVNVNLLRFLASLQPSVPLSLRRRDSGAHNTESEENATMDDELGTLPVPAASLRRQPDSESC
ncbi:hypothetical protein [Cryobacterium algoricola]|uniref:hypothetical protein n=1 Tax=Cryobacterium algoricola TaxID=1259183 RepID=UPI00141ACD45